jgi:hypothetical protein
MRRTSGNAIWNNLIYEFSGAEKNLKPRESKPVRHSEDNQTNYTTSLRRARALTSCFSERAQSSKIFQNLAVVTAGGLYCRSPGIGQDPAEIELFGGLIFLAGEKALEEFGAFLFIALNAKPQEDFTGLRNTPGLSLRHIFEFLL